MQIAQGCQPTGFGAVATSAPPRLAANANNRLLLGLELATEAALVFGLILSIEHDDVVKRVCPESFRELAHESEVQHDPGGIGIHERVIGLARGTDNEDEDTREKHTMRPGSMDCGRLTGA